ncbi:MAG: hypothetical protein JWO46_1194 [Nocardioidaceae bacterium]|nr:hypothetical protein [Nocardioidaceae bacterium]
MSTSLDPEDFARLMDRSFAGEPAHPPVSRDLRAGRSRLRRGRLAAAGGLVAVLAVLTTSYLTLGGESSEPLVAARISDADVVARCLASRHVSSDPSLSPTAMRAAMGDARLTTRAQTASDLVATLVSADGAQWGLCRLPLTDEARGNQLISIYPTAVALDAQPDLSDPTISGTDHGDPAWGTTCFPTGVREDSTAFFRAMARCPTYQVVFSDRLGADVVAVKVHDPDGSTGWADVQDGYVSYAHRGRMTPAMARTVRSGQQSGTVKLELYDATGQLLDPATHPSLASWLS